MSDGAERQPITSHRHFAAAMGLGFAVLIGGVVFILPGAVHQTLAARLGLGTIAVEGLSARLIVTGIGALLGLIFGLALGRRIVRADAAAAAGAQDDPLDRVGDDEEPQAGADAEENAAGLRRPFNPREEMTGDGITPGYATDTQPVKGDSDGAREEDYVPHSPEDVRSETASPLADLSLGDLTARLARAIDTASRRSDTQVSAADSGGEADVISFLRREADRAIAQPDSPGSRTADPQAVLRQALDKLSRVSNPR